MTDLERIVQVRPAYDCIVNQPCVHGSPECGTKPGANHGRHNAEMHMTLRGPKAEITLVIGTGWDLPETLAHVRSVIHNDYWPRGVVVHYHSAEPMYEGQTPQGSPCDLWPMCYGDAGYGIAEEPGQLLVREGSDAVWRWLEVEYAERFAAVTT